MPPYKQRFFSIGCGRCPGLQIGHTPESYELIPIFTSRILAQIALDDWKDTPDFVTHPPRIVEIEVTILPNAI